MNKPQNNIITRKLPYDKNKFCPFKDYSKCFIVTSYSYYGKV